MRVFSRIFFIRTICAHLLFFIPFRHLLFSISSGFPLMAFPIDFVNYTIIGWIEDSLIKDWKEFLSNIAAIHCLDLKELKILKTKV
ncbi:hypothetical protein RIR_jg28399.t1 [Rhizophagus irregularis DAOM 181602=DAOM 197198]|nr:hypothetical protein RIR_jg28399.t1 [Rhizophagus irregularis DAOM 181602=DAOM 197198]